MLNPIINITILNSKNEELASLGFKGQIPLLRCDWSLEISDHGSSCSFDMPLIKSVLDKLMSVKPYEPPKQTNSSAEGVSGIGNSSGGSSKEEHIKIIVDEAKRQGITNKQHIAYILATVEHETTWVNFTELASGSAYEGRSDLGNTQAGDGVRYKGRGYVQLTGRVNYAKYSKITGKDLIGNPELASQNPVMAFVLIHGFKNGSFTGAKLSDYSTAGGGLDYYNARAIINGDKATVGSSIASLAKSYESHPALSSLSQTSNPDKAKSVSQSPTVTSAQKDSARIIIRVGGDGVLYAEYVYLMSEVKVDISNTSKRVTVNGITPLWAINTYKRTETLSNLTLKQLAERVCRSTGLTLEFIGKGSEFIHLENNGLTDYQLLLRECKKAGYIISNIGTKMIVKPIRSTKSYEIELTNILSFTSSLAPSSPLAQTSGGIRGSWSAKPKTQSDVVSGSINSKPTSSNKPNQPKKDKESKTTGLVTLDNGKSVTESQAQTELSRVQDNPSSITLVPNIEALLISPTDIIKIIGLNQYSDVLSRIAFWVSSVAFQYSNTGLLMELGLYKPGIEVKVAQELSGNSSTLSDSLPSTDDESFGLPMRNFKQNNFNGTGFGDPRPGRLHLGIDGGDSSVGDDNIYASKSGVIKTASVLGGYGNAVEIIHSGGYSTLYAHMSSIAVRVGQKVSKGQKIGVIGNTGGNYAIHLHFEVYKGNQAINPRRVLPNI